MNARIASPCWIINNSRNEGPMYFLSLDADVQYFVTNGRRVYVVAGSSIREPCWDYSYSSFYFNKLESVSKLTYYLLGFQPTVEIILLLTAHFEKNDSIWISVNYFLLGLSRFV